MVRASIHLGIAVFALALCIPGTTAAAPIAVAIKAGLSAATLHGNLPTDPFVKHGTRLGLGGGLSVTIGMRGRFALQPEMLYVMKGTSLGEADLTNSSGTVIGTAKVTEANDYLEFPLLARVSIAARGPVAPYLLAGTALGMRLSQKLKGVGGNGTSTDLDFVKKSDVGVALGGGCEVGRGRARLSFEVRYTRGLTHATEATYSDDARNGALLAMAGVAFHP